MAIHDHFATFMAKLDRRCGYMLNSIGVNAPGWLIYTRLSNIGGCLVREHYFFGVVVFAEIVE
jgi:hypothetical protein